MAYTNKQDQRDAWKRWYAKNKKSEYERVRNRRLDLKSKFQEFKLALKCSRCTENHPACLQFHHKDPKIKDISISKALHDGWSINRINKEISKCEILCANCHFKEHDHSGMV